MGNSTTKLPVYTYSYTDEDGPEEHRHSSGHLRASECPQARRRELQRHARPVLSEFDADWRTNAGFLTDAPFLVDYARGDDAAIAYLAAHDDVVIGASTVVLSELYRGLLITQEMTRAEAPSKYERVEAVPFTNDAAAETAAIHADSQAAGTTSNRSDVYIAGTARALGVPPVVGNDDSVAIEDPSVEAYRQ